MPTPIKTKAQLQKITPFSNDVFRLDFAVERRYTRFAPGQFLHLTLEEFDPTAAYWPESRVFSICSVPKSETVSLVYSVKGMYTARMRQELREGAEYWLKMPYGDFIIEQLVPNGATVVLVAGGTGISPFVSYLQQGLTSGFGHQVYLGYAVRSGGRIGFGEVLRATKDSGAVTMRVWSEEALSGGQDGALVTDAGRLDLDLVVADTSNAWDRHFLLSGPPAMLKAFSARLRERYGIEEYKIHIDEWE